MEAVLAEERREHTGLQTAVEVVCDALSVVQADPRGSSLRNRLGALYERARTLVRDALHLGVRRAFAVFKSHYTGVNLEALSEGYAAAPEAELEAADEEAVNPASILAA